MSTPFDEWTEPERVVHEPARLTIMTALSACRRAEFMFLQAATGFTRGNLSTHLAKLEQSGLVRLEKTFSGKVPQTLVELTDEGREVLERHWERLERLRKVTAKQVTALATR